MSRLRLAAPFTVIPSPGVVHLVAGEDMRFTLAAPALDTWLPALLASLDGTRSTEDALRALPEEARDLVDRLVGERVLVDAPAPPPGEPHRLIVEGSSALADAIRARAPRGDESARPLRILCQDALDLHAALEAGRRARRDGEALLWVTTGPGARGLVSPVFEPEDGPCLTCLVGATRRLSPVPEILDALVAHAASGGVVQPLPFPARAASMLADLALWKAESAGLRDVPAAVFELHVLEVRAMTIEAHAVPLDDGCPDCGA